MIRKDKRSSFGGKLGEEFNAIWSALIANQIIPADGMEVNQTSSGTVLKPKTTGGNTDGDTIQQNSGVIQTRRITFESLGFGEHAGQALQYNKEELFFIDDMGRIIAKPPIQDRDFPAGVVNYSIGLRPTSAVFWGKNDLGQPSKLGGILTNPFDAPYDRDAGQAFLYPLIESLVSNGGDWMMSAPHAKFMYNVAMTEYISTPTLITPIDPPIYLLMHPEIGLGSILKAGSYMSTVDTTAGNFDTMIKPHISSAFGPLAIKCSYIDLNIEGRHWYNTIVPLDISHRH